MPQYINNLRVPGEGRIQHIAGFGQGDYGYDVLVTSLKKYEIPCVMYYFVENGIKRSVLIAKLHGGYFIEYGTYSYLDSLYSHYNERCTLKRVPRKYLLHTVKAYRAYRILYNEYINIRAEIFDAVNGIECIYLGNMAYDMEGLVMLLERIGFQTEIIDINTIKTKEGIHLSRDGICFKEFI